VEVAVLLHLPGRRRVRPPSGFRCGNLLSLLLHVHVDGDRNVAAWLVHQAPCAKRLQAQIAAVGGVNTWTYG